jgi:hypothetical protein
MATYSIKLVEHADYKPAQEQSIQAAVKQVFDRAFDGTADAVVVAWGSGTSADNLVVHFVPDVDHSYLKQRWPNANINPMAGGHTYTGDRPLAGTEVYRKRNGTLFHPIILSFTVFHEAMHNLFPFQTTAFVHELDGGGKAAGLANAHYSVETEMTIHNKELIRQGFSVKSPQYL